MSKKIDSKKFFRDLEKFINNQNNKFLLVDTERYVFDWLKKSLTKTQMRNIFDLIKNCTSVEELKMTKPRLMYTAGRLSGSGKYFLLDLSKQVTKIENEKQMEAMKRFIETVLAYHKYHANN